MTSARVRWRTLVEVDPAVVPALAQLARWGADWAQEEDIGVHIRPEVLRAVAELEEAAGDVRAEMQRRREQGLSGANRKCLAAPGNSPTITAMEAGEILGVGDRRARQMLAGRGRREGRGLVFDRTTVERLAAERSSL